MNRTWLAYANTQNCRHREALNNLHFINWTMNMNRKFNIGDIVYLYVSDEKSVRFKTKVVAANCKRGDSDYWNKKDKPKIKKKLSYPTYKLELIKEYFGEDLAESFLIQHEYKPRSLQSPMYNNPSLFQYIDEVFNDSINVKAFADKDEELIRTGQSFGDGGESDSHKELKEFIYNNPQVIGIKEYVYKEMEHTLLSADRIDVWFEQKDGSCIAVEIKSAKSCDADIMRGLFQCVKYKAIMDAENKVKCSKASNSSILVLGGSLSEQNINFRDKLGIKVYENLFITI